jgi:hypothetical protein
LQEDFSSNDHRRYAQELYAAHIRAERALMGALLSDPPENICRFHVVSDIHRRFYEQLPTHHLFTHGPEGFR